MKTIIMMILACLAIKAMEIDKTITDDFFTDSRARIRIHNPVIKEDRCIVTVEAAYDGPIRDMVEIEPDQVIIFSHDDKKRESKKTYAMTIMIGDHIYKASYHEPIPYPYFSMDSKKRKWKRADNTLFINK